MILSCPKFQRFSLFANLQNQSFAKKQRCRHSETHNIYFGLWQIRLPEEKAKTHKKSDKVLEQEQDQTHRGNKSKKIVNENLLGS